MIGSVSMKPWLALGLVLAALAPWGCASDGVRSEEDGLGRRSSALVDPAVQRCPTGQYCWYLPAAPRANAHSNPTNYRLAFSVTEGSANGTYSVNGGAPQPFTVAVGTTTSFSIATADLALSGYNQTERKGVFVICDTPVSVSLYRDGSNSRDSVAGKEKTFGFGRRFRLGGHPRNTGSQDGEGRDMAVVYAPFGGDVTFEAPPGFVGGYWDGQTDAQFTVTLQPGESFGVHTQKNVCGAELDGSLVTSTEDITVITGGRGFGSGNGLDAACETNGGCGDAGFDMPVAIESLGTRYVVNDTASNSGTGEGVRVVADFDNTEVFFNGSNTPVATLDAGEFYEDELSGGSPVFIETSQPAVVYQHGGGPGCELGSSFIPPLFFPNVSLTVSFDAPLANNSVFVVTNADDEANITVDGSPITSATAYASQGVPGTDSDDAGTEPDLNYITFTVTQGAHEVASPKDFQLGVLSSGSGTGLFGYYSPHRRPDCGNGLVESGETCDDGNVLNFDGCDGNCTLEDTFVCTGEPSACLESVDNCQQVGTLGQLSFGASDDSVVGQLAGARSAGETTVSNLFGANEYDISVDVDGATTLSGSAMVPGANNVVRIAFQLPSSTAPVLMTGLRFRLSDFDPGETVTAIRVLRSDGETVALDLTDTGVFTGDLDFAAGLTSSQAAGNVVVDLTDAMVTAVEFEFGPTAPNLEFLSGSLMGRCLSSCGDGILQPSEGCDDGGSFPGDGCSEGCLIENGNRCNAFSPGATGSASCAGGACNGSAGPPGICTEADACGNAVVDSDEGCDDGNDVSGDGCNAQCLIEEGFDCNDGPVGLVGSASCAFECDAGTCQGSDTCGDGTVDAREGCDTSGDSVTCTADCKVKSGNACGPLLSSACDSGLCASFGPDAGNCVDTGCGNGVVESGEGCDEGADNGTADSFCDGSCLINDGGTCGTTSGALTGAASCASGSCYTNAGAPGACLPGVAPASGCGDGILEIGEGCDDGTGPVGTGGGSPSCDTDCLIRNGNACNFVNPGLEAAESCESGICNLGVNPPTCVAEDECGNGTVEESNDESCDDSNTDSNDGCSADCLKEAGVSCGEDECETGLVCDPTSSVCESVNVCGNGVLEAAEGCDDGGTGAGDGCDAGCLVENTHPCNENVSGLTGNNSCQSGLCQAGTCTATNACGNGIIESGEGCDDGTGSPAGTGAGSAVCTTACLIVDGNPCNTDTDGVLGDGSCDSGVCDETEATGTCEPALTCGNAKLETDHTVVDTGLPESCDDGNTTAGDGCGVSCLLENGAACSAGPECQSSLCQTDVCVANNVCGNGAREAGEGCDDGTAFGGGSGLCNDSCLIPDGQSCNAVAPGLTGAASCASSLCPNGTCVAQDVCGNGVLETGEGCDDGTAGGGGSAGCNDSCRIPNGEACNVDAAGLVGDGSCASGNCDSDLCAEESSGSGNGGNGGSNNGNGGGSTGGATDGGVAPAPPEPNQPAMDSGVPGGGNDAGIINPNPDGGLAGGALCNAGGSPSSPVLFWLGLLLASVVRTSSGRLGLRRDQGPRRG